MVTELSVWEASQLYPQGQSWEWLSGEQMYVFSPNFYNFVTIVKEI